MPQWAPPNQWIAPWGNIAIHCTSDIIGLVLQVNWIGAAGDAWLKATDPEREFGAVRIDDDKYRLNTQPGGGIGGRA